MIICPSNCNLFFGIGNAAAFRYLGDRDVLYVDIIDTFTFIYNISSYLRFFFYSPVICENCIKKKLKFEIPRTFLTEKLLKMVCHL